MEIKGKVHYVGVNDRSKALFENLWPLPYGVSYNSYLIADDEMVALVDTVDVAFFEVYLKKIRAVIGDRKINYLIINHMEPDHSGSIALIKQYYPDIVLVGNKKTFDMVEGYYGVGGDRYVVVCLLAVGVVVVHGVVRHGIIAVIDDPYLPVEIHGQVVRFLFIKRVVAVFHDAAFRREEFQTFLHGGEQGLFVSVRRLIPSDCLRQVLVVGFPFHSPEQTVYPAFLV